MKKWIFVIAFLFTSFTADAKEIPDELKDLYAQSAVLMDAESGRILFGKNEQNPMPMASTTKILTCILVLENADLHEIAEVSEYAADQPKVHLGVRPGEQYYIEDLLYSLMLESHNDSAVVLAEHISGTVSGFAFLMNEKAKEIGCKNSYFITPNGLDAKDENGEHSTTASDLAKIMKYCIYDSLHKDTFLQITQKRGHDFADVSQKRKFNCINRNAFLDMMDGALSGKTGFTNQAGYCYVGALEKNGECYIVALLACGWPSNKSYKWKDTKSLMEYGINHYEYKEISQIMELADCTVKNGMPEKWEHQVKTPVRIENADEKICVLIGPDEKIECIVNVPKEVEAPVYKNTVAGELIYCVGSEKVAVKKVLFAKDVAKESWKKYLEKITKNILFYE